LENNNKYKEKKEKGKINNVKLYISLIRKKAYRKRIKGFRLRNDVPIKERIKVIKDISNIYKNIKNI